ncbi:NAD(P)-dependent oxidoreductase [Deinococcus metallilatus]|uniref:Homoserine dehydrogenase-like protein n=1 Tax=Deinococcus metallilatus TaxID=1211322 RepID=A0AAJ5K3M8_9DEIO|nr:SAF domain-containing protein [Deinococcus metallilatus]MBB5296827.1 putative homoserine dehydrogenase-like protein [Deinococcus metallilatus]QBY09565.1 NAD(P)-dependent oxidoreductase [Deinococcus metallilatus]RXJ09169.1 NAD(P)-dependent oxidoreductase [Deinococcus metallilatus]TLK22787.1 NAD(P)-dependent oxidoreductase [Deinococcus metallilatus]GMA13858.1 NAD(P)-dependent oxidoreductase [Deinococcus metallilatus]
MIMVDTALRRREAEGRPVRVAMIGAGFMGRGVANQIINSVPGMELVAISNRNIANAERAYSEAGRTDFVRVETQAQLEDAIRRGQPAVTDDALLLCRSEQVDCLLDVTGDVEFGAQVTLEAIAHGRHMVTMNAELDATVGPLLKRRADAAGVILTAADGDQPGVQMNLYRFVRSIGLTPLVCGNIKGLQDPYRTPTTQKAFAERWGQNVNMVTSFADGTKISFEQAIVANGTGMRVERRGMRGTEFSGHVDELTKMYDVDELRRLGGVVDYTVGSKPGPGVFVLAAHDDPKQRHYLNLYKLGEGPLYSFYVPYHLCHFEVPLSAARVVLFGDAILQPLGAPQVDVIATAKTDLPAGTVLDGLGGYHTYGQCENADVVQAQRLLPMGLAVGCRLRRPVPRDQVLTYDDVELPAGSLAAALRAEQDRLFAPAPTTG